MRNDDEGNNKRNKCYRPIQIQQRSFSKRESEFFFCEANITVDWVDDKLS